MAFGYRTHPPSHPISTHYPIVFQWINRGNPSVTVRWRQKERGGRGRVQGRVLTIGTTIPPPLVVNTTPDPPELCAIPSRSNRCSQQDNNDKHKGEIRIRAREAGRDRQGDEVTTVVTVSYITSDRMWRRRHPSCTQVTRHGHGHGHGRTSCSSLCPTMRPCCDSGSAPPRYPAPAPDAPTPALAHPGPTTSPL